MTIKEERLRRGTWVPLCWNTVDLRKAKILAYARMTIKEERLRRGTWVPLCWNTVDLRKAKILAYARMTSPAGSRLPQVGLFYDAAHARHVGLYRGEILFRRAADRLHADVQKALAHFGGSQRRDDGFVQPSQDRRRRF